MNLYESLDELKDSYPPEMEEWLNERAQEAHRKKISAALTELERAVNYAQEDYADWEAAQEEEGDEDE